MKLENQIDELIENIIILPFFVIRDLGRLAVSAVLMRSTDAAQMMIDEAEDGRSVCGPYLLLLVPALFLRMVRYGYDPGRWHASAQFDFTAATSMLKAIFGLGKWDALGAILIAAFSMLIIYDLVARGAALLFHWSDSEQTERLRKVILYQSAAILTWAPLLGWVLIPPLMPRSGAEYPHIRIVLGILVAFVVCANMARALPTHIDTDTRSGIANPLLIVILPLFLSNAIANFIQAELAPVEITSN